MFLFGRYVGLDGVLRTWLPWAILVTVGAYFGRWQFAAAYGGLVAAVGIYFLLFLSPNARLAMTEKLRHSAKAGREVPS